jgi:hypothetical protein
VTVLRRKLYFVTVLVCACAVTVANTTVFPLATVTTGGVTVDVTSLETSIVIVDALVVIVVVAVAGVGSVTVIVFESGARLAIPARYADRFSKNSA